MLNEVIKISLPSVGGNFIDCTFGGGGYSKEILKFSKTKVQALDRDEKVLSTAKKNLRKNIPKDLNFIKLSLVRLIRL